ncbi:MAG: AAA family ATPase, partial [Gemmataceae bacterium]|nr:AAA family ATPase [Gemmataceae bacterium]
MKLSRVEITDYKSIRRSNPFEVGDITCLVGKNESGKTAVLQALYKLNPVVAEHGNFDVTDEYPRAEVEEYRQRVEAEEEAPAVVVRVEYTLGPDEVGAVERVYGAGVLPSPTIRLSKGYDNEVVFELTTDEAAAVRGLVANHTLPDEVARRALTATTLGELQTVLDADGKERQQAHAAARAAADAEPDPDARTKAVHQADLMAESEAAKKLKGVLLSISTAGLAGHIWTHHLKARWPKFLYFDEYHQMEGHVNIEKLKERQTGQNGLRLKDSDRPMLGLIELARLDLDQLMTSQRTDELVASLEGASNHLSKQVLRYWSQNRHLKVRFDVRQARPGDPGEMSSGTNLWGRVYDSVHEA